MPSSETGLADERVSAIRSDHVNSLEANLRAIATRIEHACARVGRDPTALRVIAVSKRQPSQAIADAYDLGLRDFGENYVQELQQKHHDLERYPDIRWHMIGRLQRNKARHVVRSAQVLHTLDSVELVEEVNRRALGDGVKIEAFVAVNVASEEQKSGCDWTALPELVAAARSSAGIQLLGLMAIPPAADDAEVTRAHFVRLREAAEGLHLPRLSMGMSSDFEVAIEEGATDVRIGSALFGARD